jgi:hypothetical protein
MQYTHEQLIDISRFNPEDITQIRKCRQEQSRLGFGYQLAFVRLLNRFPTQTPFEVINDILAYVSIQLNIPSERLDTYNQRQPTASSHQETIRKYRVLSASVCSQKYFDMSRSVGYRPWNG